MSKRAQEEKQTRKPSVFSVYEREVENNANGVLAMIFRRLTARLGYTHKLKTVCKAAQTRDKMYRMEINSPTLDEKLEYRLYQMATAPKMTFDGLTKLISHLFNVVEFKFKVSIKVKGSQDWIEIEQSVINATGPITDIHTLDEEEIELLEEAQGEENGFDPDNIENN